MNLLPKDIEEVRTIEIVGLDLQADGGTHVANTEEVGQIKVVEHKSKGKMNKRIKIQLDENIWRFALLCDIFVIFFSYLYSN